METNDASMCHHGYLASQCLQCLVSKQEIELAALKQELADKDQRIEDLEDEFALIDRE